MLKSLVGARKPTNLNKKIDQNPPKLYQKLARAITRHHNSPANTPL